MSKKEFIFDIVGVGTTAMDILIQVDHLPKKDGFCVIQSKQYIPGGSGTNVIVQASRLSANCAYIAKVGNDDLGIDTLKSLEEENINIDGMVQKDGGRSLNSEIVVDNSGEKFILLDMGDCFLSLDSSQIDYDIISKSKVLYTDLIPGEPAFKALKTAKENNLKTAFNLQVELTSMNSFGISKEFILNALKYVDLFAPCQAGLYQLCGTEDIDQCISYIRKYFSGTLLLTLGKKGSLGIMANGTKISQSIFEIEAIDTTGAGDSYMGAMLYSYLLKDNSLKDSMKFASACSAITCSNIGARCSPTLNQAKAFLIY